MSHGPVECEDLTCDNGECITAQDAQDHLADECTRFWSGCRKIHRLMTRRVERELQDYYTLAVLVHRREGVIYSTAPDMESTRALFEQAKADMGDHDLIFYVVPDPNVAHFY